MAQSPRPGHLEALPGQPVEQKVYYRVTATLSGRGYRSAGLASREAVRAHIAWLRETRGVTEGVRVYMYVLSEEVSEVDAAEFM